MKYKDGSGTVLYGFSQENLEKTNREIKRTNRLLQAFIILFALFFVIFIAFLIWLEINDVITRIIYQF